MPVEQLIQPLMFIVNCDYQYNLFAFTWQLSGLNKADISMNIFNYHVFVDA